MFFIYIYLFMVFLASSLYLTQTFNSIGSVLIGMTVILILPLILLFKKRNYEINIFSLIFMFLFLIASMFSAYLNGDINLIISAGMILILYIASMIIIPSLLENRSNKIVYKSIMISHLPIIFFPLVIYGINSTPYRGIFYNPNSFGSIVATLFATMFALFLFKLENYYMNKKQSIRNLMFNFLLLFAIFFLIVLSGSRTSVLTAVGIVLIGISIVFIRLFRSKKAVPLIKSFFVGSVLIVGSAVLMKVTSFYEYLYFNILYKFEIKSDDVLDNRGIVWEVTLKEAGLFGQGSDYFNQTLVGAHNTFISILGEYGWIPLILFCIIIIYGLIKSLIYAFSKVQDQYKFLPIMFMVCFILLSMGEGMMFKLSMIAMFFSVGSTIRSKSNIKEYEKMDEERITKQYKKPTKIRRRIVWKKQSESSVSLTPSDKRLNNNNNA